MRHCCLYNLHLYFITSLFFFFIVPKLLFCRSDSAFLQSPVTAYVTQIFPQNLNASGICTSFLPCEFIYFLFWGIWLSRKGVLYSCWPSVCKSSIESSTALGVIKKNGAWWGNYVNSLFDLNRRSFYVVFWPHGWLLCSTAACPNISSAFSIHVLWLGAITFSIAFNSEILRVRRRGRSKSFFMTVASRQRLLFKDETLALLVLEIFQNLWFWNGFCAEIFSSPWELKLLWSTEEIAENPRCLIEWKHIKLPLSLTE